MPHNLVRALSLLLFAAAAAGCDLGGAYEKKLQETLQTAGQRAVFDLSLHTDYREVTDASRQNVGVKFRMPKAFDDKSESLAANNPRVQAPIALPGLSYAIERQFDDETGQFLPAYCYLAAAPKGEQKAEAFQAAVAQQVAATVRGGAWSDVTLPTPTGSSVSLKRLRAEGQQPFMNIQKKAPAAADGRLDLYYIDAGNHHVLIGSRVPKAQAQKYQLEPAIDAAMGTVEITAPPPAAPGGKAAAPAGKAASGCM